MNERFPFTLNQPERKDGRFLYGSLLEGLEVLVNKVAPVCASRPNRQEP